MKITLLQTDIKWSDTSANQQTAESIMLKAEASDLYLLPEMWSTGFATEPQGIAEQAGEDGLSPSAHWMQRMASQLSAAVAGSVAVALPGGTVRNRFYFVTPDGSVTIYDKHHLFSCGGEHHHYTAGQQRVIVQWKQLRILLQICYDLRFPVFSRNRGDYDLAIYVANWPHSRRTVWDTLLRARALENQSYVIGVNRVGDDQQCHYSGGTALIDAYGRTLAAADDDTQQALTVTIDTDHLQQFRQKFPVLNDADHFKL